jgi:hypothetical protein
MSAAIQKAMRAIEKEQKGPTVQHDETMGGFPDEHYRDMTIAWKRMTMRMLITRDTASMCLLDKELYMTALDKQDEFIASVHEQVELGTVVTRAEVLLRKQLTRSTGKHRQIDQSECPHHMLDLKCRGGKTHWWSCEGCGSRWPRAAGEDLVFLHGRPVAKPKAKAKAASVASSWEHVDIAPTA